MFWFFYLPTYDYIKKDFIKLYSIDNKYGIPKDVINKDSIIQIVGKNQIIVENYKCIKKYSLDEIVILGFSYTINIKGTNLTIEYYNNESMMVGGCIDEISFL